MFLNEPLNKQMMRQVMWATFDIKPNKDRFEISFHHDHLLLTSDEFVLDGIFLKIPTVRQFKQKKEFVTSTVSLWANNLRAFELPVAHLSTLRKNKFKLYPPVLLKGNYNNRVTVDLWKPLRDRKSVV